MYDIDEDLAKGYDHKKVASTVRVPKLPNVDGLNYDADLLSVIKDKAPMAGKLYAFKFRVTKSNNELVPEGGVYVHKFYVGNPDSEVDRGKFWNKITPILMAVFGETTLTPAFVSPERLGELRSLTDDLATSGGGELGLKFRGSRVMGEARPDRTTGKYAPDDLNADGSPKKFPRDNFQTAA